MVHPRDTLHGINKYTEFHDYDPKDVGRFPAAFKLPRTVEKIGPALWVCYRSSKWDEGSHDYIHEHSKGTMCYLPGRGTPVPKRITQCHTLVDLGRCLGFGYRDELEEDIDLSAKHRLFCTPDGRALVIVKDKRHVIAMIWGGQLRVEDRGIVD